MHHQSHLFLLLRDLPSPAKLSTHSSHLSPSCPSPAPALPQPCRAKPSHSQRHVTDRRESHKGLWWRPRVVRVQAGAPKRIVHAHNCKTIFCQRSSKEPRACGLWTQSRAVNEARHSPEPALPSRPCPDPMFSFVIITDSLKELFFLRQHISEKSLAPSLCLLAVDVTKYTLPFSKLPERYKCNCRMRMPARDKEKKKAPLCQQT